MASSAAVSRSPAAGRRPGSQRTILAKIDISPLPHSLADADFLHATDAARLLPGRLGQQVAELGDEAEGQEIGAASYEYLRSCNPSSTGASRLYERINNIHIERMRWL